LKPTFREVGPKGHPLPVVLDAPPSEWTIPFQALATECGMKPDLAATFESAAKFYQEVLSDFRESADQFGACFGASSYRDSVHLIAAKCKLKMWRMCCI
jgi:hypothetical protein